MPVSPISSATTPTPESKAMRQAGEQFEAMMLERMLASARPATSGPETDWRAMADRQVAASLAPQSPLGLADMITKSVGKTDR